MPVAYNPMAAFQQGFSGMSSALNSIDANKRANQLAAQQQTLFDQQQRDRQMKELALSTAARITNPDGSINEDLLQQTVAGLGPESRRWAAATLGIPNGDVVSSRVTGDGEIELTISDGKNKTKNVVVSRDEFSSGVGAALLQYTNVQANREATAKAGSQAAAFEALNPPQKVNSLGMGASAPQPGLGAAAPQMPPPSAAPQMPPPSAAPQMLPGFGGGTSGGGGATGAAPAMQPPGIPNRPGRPGSGGGQPMTNMTPPARVSGGRNARNMTPQAPPPAMTPEEQALRFGGGRSGGGGATNAAPAAAPPARPPAPAPANTGLITPDPEALGVGKPPAPGQAPKSPNQKAAVAAQQTKFAPTVSEADQKKMVRILAQAIKDRAIDLNTAQTLLDKKTQYTTTLSGDRLLVTQNGQVVAVSDLGPDIAKQRTLQIQEQNAVVAQAVATYNAAKSNEERMQARSKVANETTDLILLQQFGTLKKGDSPDSKRQYYSSQLPAFIQDLANSFSGGDGSDPRVVSIAQQVMPLIDEYQSNWLNTNWEDMPQPMDFVAAVRLFGEDQVRGDVENKVNELVSIRERVSKAVGSQISSKQTVSALMQFAQTNQLQVSDPATITQFLQQVDGIRAKTNY